MTPVCSQWSRTSATVCAIRAKGSLFNLLNIRACPFSSMFSLAGACNQGSPSICIARVSKVVMQADEHWHNLLALESPTCSWPRCQLPYTPTTCKCSNYVSVNTVTDTIQPTPQNPIRRHRAVAPLNALMQMAIGETSQMLLPDYVFIMHIQIT